MRSLEDLGLGFSISSRDDNGYTKMALVQKVTWAVGGGARLRATPESAGSQLGCVDPAWSQRTSPAACRQVGQRGPKGGPIRAGLGVRAQGPCVPELSTAGPAYLGGERELRPVTRAPGEAPSEPPGLHPPTPHGHHLRQALSLPHRCKSQLKARDLPRVCTVTASTQAVTRTPQEALGARPVRS